MALVVEDGSGVAGANSYATLAQAHAYAADRGVTLGDDAAITAQLINATDYLESFDYIGSPVSFTQSLSWPRINVIFDPDNPFPSNEIPPQLVAANCQLVIEQANGIVIQPSVDHASGGFITQEKVDVLEVRYSERIGTTSQPLMPKVATLLRTLIVTQLALRTVRI